MKHIKPNRQIGSQFAFYLNPQQRAIIQSGITLAGKSRSDFLRDAAIEAARKLIDDSKNPTAAAV